MAIEQLPSLPLPSPNIPPLPPVHYHGCYIVSAFFATVLLTSLSIINVQKNYFFFHAQMAAPLWRTAKCHSPLTMHHCHLQFRKDITSTETTDTVTIWQRGVSLCFEAASAANAMQTVLHVLWSLGFGDTGTCDWRFCYCFYDRSKASSVSLTPQHNGVFLTYTTRQIYLAL